MGDGRLARTIAQWIAVGCTLVYCALFPGATITVALDAVPDWGVWMGALLLYLQGIAAIGWLAGSYGRRGVGLGLVAFTLAWAVEHLGETTGLLFGRYAYTDLLQPQIAGVVPLPITCAWLMVALGSWQLARQAAGPEMREERPKIRGLRQRTGLWSVVCNLRSLVSARWSPRGRLRPLLLAATLVVTLDLQIETVATQVNHYWVWFDGGPYYGVPPHNFLGWWLVGLAMALLTQSLLGASTPLPAIWRPGWVRHLFAGIPALMYLFSSVMFTVVNLARGFPLAGLVGLTLLAIVAIVAISGRIWTFAAPIGAPVVRQTSD